MFVSLLPVSVGTLSAILPSLRAVFLMGLTTFFFDLSDVNAASLIVARFFVGDIIELFVGLVVLAFIFRMSRKIKVT